jgi:Flp pilus assembly protein TadD
MYPRFDSNERTHCELRSLASTGLLLLAFVLSACSSSPSSAPAPTNPSAKSEATSASKSPRGKSQDVEEGAALVSEEPLPPEAVQQFDAAVVHMNAGDDAAAEQAFRNLASSYPKYSGALVNLGILQSKGGRLEEAEATFKAALERHATNATALNQLGIIYRKLGRFQDADQAYQQATQADPNYANAYFNLGVLCDLYLQQPERALQAYERYLELSPSPDARVNAWVNELKKRIGAEPRAARSE